jgi:hypothetical protein
MELVPARSLQRVLAEDGPLPPRQAAQTGMMLLGALASAHAVGIVHRDVKPGNVLLTRGGRAVLTDFGIAVVDGDPALTQTGMVMGTPGFCAPERIRGEPASPASDLWSLGATLYAAVEGRAPFDGHGSPMAVLASIVHSDPPPARSAGPMTAVIGALLSKDPARRPDAACASRMLADAAATSRVMADIGASQGYPGGLWGYVGAGRGYVGAGQASSGAGQDYAGAELGYADAGQSYAGAGQGYAGAAWGFVGAGQGYPSAGASPACADADLGFASADRADASARTDPTGFPASAPTASPATPGRTTFPVGPAPDAPLARPSSLPFADGTGTAQFPAGAGPDFLPPGTGPTPLPTGMGVTPLPANTDDTPPWAGTGAGPPPANMGATPPWTSTSPAPPPARMGAAPPPASSGAAALPAGPGLGTGGARRSGTRPTPGRRWLALGLAGAAIVVAGLAAGLVWSRMAGPPAHGVAGRPAHARSTGGAPVAAAPLPAGYWWYTRPAVPAGTAPGFMMAVPAGWQARQQGITTYLRNAASGGIISVSRPPVTVSGPVREARALERAALGKGSLAGYRRIAVTPFVLRGKLAGAWRFTYRQPGTGAMDGLVVVMPGGAPGNGQPYALMATAPAAYWPHTRTVFAEALRTFSPRG